MLKSRLSAMTCTLALACSPAALAAPYSSLYVFGDSLGDAGQFTDPDSPTGGPLRYTNREGPGYQPGEAFGYTSPMMLGQQLGISPDQLAASQQGGKPGTGNNYATGGWRTDQILQSITGVPGDPTRPGYLGNGRRADPNALYYLVGGANDFFQGQVLSLKQAQAAADRLSASAYALQQGGARYIMVWLLPDIGNSPLGHDTGLGPLFSPLGAAFNQQLLANLGKIDAEIIPLNVPGLFSEVLAQPEQFGFLSGNQAVTTCFSGEGCTENAQYGIHSDTPDPSKLLFNDGVHPTTAGHQLVTDYAASLLAAPWEITMLPEMANGAVAGHQSALRDQWQSPWQALGDWQLLLSADDTRIKHSTQDTSAGGDGRGQRVLLGASYRPNEDWRIGFAGGFDHQKLTLGASDSRYTLDSYLLSLFSQYRGEHLWGDLTATGASYAFDSQRRFALGITTRAEKGETEGMSLGFGGRLGYDLAMRESDWHLSPFVSAYGGRTSIDGYRESGQRVTALSFNRQQRDSRRLGVGVQGAFALTQRTALQGELSHEREFEDSTQTLGIRQNSLPSLPFTLQGYEVPGSTTRASLGLSYQLAQDWSVQGGYSWQRSSGVTQQGIGAGLKLAF